MAIDQTANFVRATISSAIQAGDSIINLSDSGQLIDPANGEYNLVVWDPSSYPRPDQDPAVEIVRATALDSGANELTVSRGQETTSAADHPVEAVLALTPTAKMFSDIDSKTSQLSADGQTYSGQSVDVESLGSSFPDGAVADKVPLEAISGANSTSNTFTVGTAYDIYEIDIFALSSSPDDMLITINGDTTSSYYQEDADGTSRAGRSNWLLGNADNDPLIGSVSIYGQKVLDPTGGESDMFPKLVGNIATGGPSGIVSGELRSTIETVSSIEFVPSGSDLSYKADIYGKNFSK